MAVKSVASGRVGELPDAFRDLCNTSKAPVVARRACTPGWCIPGLCYRLRPLLGESVTLRMETWPEVSRNPLLGILWVFIIGDFYVLLWKTGVKKSCVSVLSRVHLLETPWTVALQASLSMGFPRQECWSGLHFLLQGIFLTQGWNLCHLRCKQILYHWATGEAHVFCFEKLVWAGRI